MIEGDDVPTALIVAAVASTTKMAGWWIVTALAIC
jgi:hypothetical protein